MATEICYLTSLSQELLCNILGFLPLKNVLIIGTLNKALLSAVKSYLHLIKDIDFCEGKIMSYMSPAITDKIFKKILQTCPNLEVLRGLHISNLLRTRSRKSSGLSVPGIIESVLACPKLMKIETSNFILLEAFSQRFPKVELEGIFQNRDGIFPPKVNQQVRLNPFLRITSLHLIGVQVVELPRMSELQELHLRWIQFTRLHPFRTFSANKLRSFVMKQCIGPSFPLRYYPVFVALGLAPELTRLEIVRIPILGGMIFRAVEEGLRNGGFRKMKKLIIGDCKGIMESDFGQLMIASGESLETVYIQASLTKDSLFASLLHARCNFHNVKTLHLGFIDRFLPSEHFSEVALINMGMATLPDVPAAITDSGVKTVSQLFPNAQNIIISNCPHIISAKDWSVEGENMWKTATCLTLQRCHCLRLPPLATFISTLEKIEVITISNMFREPPKGCSHVGLSAGTGLGLSSVIVSNQDEHIAVLGNNNDAVPNNENPNADDERIFINEVENGNDLQPNYVMAQPGGSRQYQHPIVEGEHSYEMSIGGRRADFDLRGNRIETEVCQCERNQKKVRRRIPTRPFGKRKRCKKNATSNLNDLCGSSSKRSTCGVCDKKQQKTSSHSNYTGPMTRHRSQSKVNGETPCSSSCGSLRRSKRTGQSTSSDSSKSSPSSKKSKKSNIHDLSDASDSDNPYFEKDVVLVFPVTSQSLISLSVISCGISDISFKNCPKLLYIQISGCRILREFRFSHTPSVMKVSIDHCPKIRLSRFVSEVLAIYSINPMLVCLEPFIVNHDCSPSSVEEYVLKHANSHHSVAVVQKKTDENDGVHYERSLLQWLQLINNVYQKLIPDFIEKHEHLYPPEVVSYSLRELVCYTEEKHTTYPWGHYINRIIGHFSFGSYEMITNNPLFVLLWRKFIENTEGDELITNSDLEYFLRTEIPEIMEANVPMGKYHVCFLCQL